MTHEFLKNKSDIEAWLDEYEVKNYTLIEDEKYGYTVKVEGDVSLNYHDLSFIPIKFAEVSGDFQCCTNQLTSLEFSPRIVGGGFYCDSNKLTSLEFCPQTVGEDFACDYNQLSSLEFFPQEVGGSCYFSNNKDLGEYQNIEDFDILRQAHLDIVNSKKEKKLLSESIKAVNSPKNSGFNAFKI